MKHAIRLVLLFTLIFVVGCGREPQVTGKVTFPDGAPLTVGEVQFLAETHSAFGKIQADGTYRLGSMKKDDGVPPGTYSVIVVKAAQSFPTPPGGGIDDTPPPVFLIDKKFNKPETSGLTCEVSGDRQFDITVTAPEK